MSNGTEVPKLSEKDVQNVLSSWKVVQDVGLQAAGLIVFKRLFETTPMLKEKFKFFKENADISDDNEHLQKHALTVMDTVNTAVERVRAGALADLSEDLLDVGVAHHVHNITPADFAPVGEAILYALGVALGAKFTQDVKGSWVRLYTIVQVGMTPGIEKGMDAQPIDLQVE